METSFLAGIWLKGIWEACVEGFNGIQGKAASCGIGILRPVEKQWRKGVQWKAACTYPNGAHHEYGTPIRRYSPTGARAFFAFLAPRPRQIKGKFRGWGGDFPGMNATRPGKITSLSSRHFKSRIFSIHTSQKYIGFYARNSIIHVGYLAPFLPPLSHTHR